MTTEKKRKLEFTVHFRSGRNGKQKLMVGEAPDKVDILPGRVPRISKLMALAIRMDGLIRRGVVKDYAELAVLGHVTRARITQIMNLLNLAPDIQEVILFLPRIKSGNDRITQRTVAIVHAQPQWKDQRILWGKILSDE